jgi:nucleoside-diphosphate-sugar epimerase
MNILVTGATGFIGRHVVPLCLQAGHSVTVIMRHKSALSAFGWSKDVRVIEADIYQLESAWLDQIEQQTCLLHLAWQDLPNYQQDFHIKRNLPADYAFIHRLVEIGIKRVVITGTCFEYGNQEGCLNELTEALPENNYALAKNELRKQLVELQKTLPFKLIWARLFYMYGDGQSSSSLLSQLQLAVDRGDDVFNMSGGEQLRDYLPVTAVAEYLQKLVESHENDGIVNVCSGQAISVKQLVEAYLEQHNLTMSLNLGFYPYSKQEPMAFWGDNTKLLTWLKKEV